MKITCRINCIPVAQKRARSRAIPKNGKWIATTYKDKGQRLEEDKFIALLMTHAPETPFTGPLGLRVQAYFPIPKSFSKKKTLQAQQGWIQPVGRPDLDNLIKFVKDCMQGYFFQNDSQIVHLDADKFYDYEPHWWIEIATLDYVDNLN